MVWSFCNEGGCGSGANHTLASAFRQTAYDYDGTRKVSGNMRGTVGPGTLSDLIDVQGLSHPTVRKKVTLLDHSHIKNWIILPRLARDKHTESPTKRGVVCFAGRCDG